MRTEYFRKLAENSQYQESVRSDDLLRFQVVYIQIRIFYEQRYCVFILRLVVRGITVGTLVSAGHRTAIQEWRRTSILERRCNINDHISLTFLLHLILICVAPDSCTYSSDLSIIYRGQITLLIKAYSADQKKILQVQIQSCQLNDKVNHKLCFTGT